MRQTILTLLLSLTLCVPATAQSHNRKSKAKTEAVDKTQQDQGVEAYSDTTGIDTDSIVQDSLDASNDTSGLSDYNTINTPVDDMKEVSDVVKLMLDIFMPYIIIVFIVFLIVCILIFMLIRMVIKSNERRRMEAMNRYNQYQYYENFRREQAQRAPQDSYAQANPQANAQADQQGPGAGPRQGDSQTRPQGEYQAFAQRGYQHQYQEADYDDRSLWDRLRYMRVPDDPESRKSYFRGVRNFFLGIGLALFSIFIDAEPLAGIGFLVTCWGVGQIVIALSFGKNYRQPNSSSQQSGQYAPNQQGQQTEQRRQTAQGQPDDQRQDSNQPTQE